MTLSEAVTKLKNRDYNTINNSVICRAGRIPSIALQYSYSYKPFYSESANPSGFAERVEGVYMLVEKIPVIIDGKVSKISNRIENALSKLYITNLDLEATDWRILAVGEDFPF